MNDKLVILLLPLLVLWVIAVFDMIGLFPKWKSLCLVMGWHKEPNRVGFDGCSRNGCCSRCGKEVMQDSQGNWF